MRWSSSATLPTTRASGSSAPGTTASPGTTTVPDDAFMVLALAPGGLRGCAGVVSYLPEFTPA